jgi:hypothetical protein
MSEANVVLIARLESAAAEIANSGINGWGNTMMDAAEEIEQLRADNEKLRGLLRDSLEYSEDLLQQQKLLFGDYPDRGGIPFILKHIAAVEEALNND